MKTRNFIMILLLIVAGMQTAKAQYIMQVWRSGASTPYVVNDVDSVKFVKAVTSIALSQESITVGRNETYQLSAIVLPEDADVKVVAWESSDASIATVDETGLVTAFALGSCTITASTSDGSGLSSWCQVKVGDDTHGAVNGHEYVDLGLPSGTLWATCNVGAETAEDYGNYYAWGETDYKTEYVWDNYVHWKRSDDYRYLTIYRYCLSEQYGNVDNLIELLPEDDAATANWGEGWQMPSGEQIGELMDLNYVTRTLYPFDDNDPEHPAGILITSKINGNTIFLPAAGQWRNSDEASDVNNWVYYWSRTLKRGDTSAYNLGIKVRGYNDSNSSSSRCYGLSVRPVCVQETPYIWPITSLEMTSTGLGLLVGEQASLGVRNVEPSYINPLKLVYESSDESVAVYDKFTGYVTGVGLGTCTITCRVTADGEAVGVCQVTVSDGNPITIDGHEFVDLGLPSGVLWATCDVGARWFGDYGDSFAWGETETQSNWNPYSWEFYKYSWSSSSNTLTKYCPLSDYGFNGFTDDLTELLAEDDAATANWGAACKTPNKTQCEELVNNEYTVITRATINNVAGFKVISKVNGNAIFFPRDWGQDYGRYWTSTLNSETPSKAYIMYFSSNYGRVSYSENRCSGFYIRPIVVPDDTDEHEYIDLGLPSGTLWATCNVGAENPEDFGNYFAWGETTMEQRDSYNWNTYLYSEGTKETITKYNTTDEQMELLPEDDAATVNWGSNWQMPSKEQFNELLNDDLTTRTTTTLNGVTGLEITSKSNGKSIFLPAAGYLRESGSLEFGNQYGLYWSRSRCADDSYWFAGRLYFTFSIGTSDIWRFYAQSIRPVRKQ